MSSCSQLGDFDSSEVLGVVFLIAKSTFIESMGLQFVIIESADGINIWSINELLKSFLSVVELEDVLNAVEVFSDVVLVLEDSEGSLNLILVHVDLIYLNKRWQILITPAVRSRLSPC